MKEENNYIEKRLLRFLSFRMRSEKEILSYLRDNNVNNNYIGTLIKKYKGLGYIDDVAFAKAWINDRIKLKAYSKKMIAFELRGKGIDNDIIEKYIEVTDDVQYQCAVRNLRRRYKTMDVDNMKMISFLLRKGFEYNVAKRAVSDFCKKKEEV